jgi:hypothetical protein
MCSKYVYLSLYLNPDLGLIHLNVESDPSTDLRKIYDQLVVENEIFHNEYTNITKTVELIKTTPYRLMELSKLFPEFKSYFCMINNYDDDNFSELRDFEQVETLYDHHDITDVMVYRKISDDSIEILFIRKLS